MKRLAFLASFFLVGLFSLSGPASALTIDEFNDGGFSEAAVATTIGQAVAKSITSSSSIGGKRVLRIAKNQNSGANGIASIYTDGELRHNQDSAVTARSVVIWDGSTDTSDADPNPSGLGAIDMLQDGASNILIRILSRDAGFGSLDLELALFDSINPFGDSLTRIVITLDQTILNHTLSIPLSALDGSKNFNLTAPPSNPQNLNPQPIPVAVVAGAGGVADLTRIGAFKLTIYGNAQDQDLGLEFIRTDGVCVGTPDLQGDVIDDCGICVGQPGYKTSKDDCGICTNLQGYQDPKDSCGLCTNLPGYQDPRDDCLLCPNNPNFNNSKDDCGVCTNLPGYQNPKDSCQRCPSNPNFSRPPDPCGVCDGDGSSCADCQGTPLGSASIDVCNVCAGNGTTCLDCAGIPFGSTGLDACGICGGDGKSCLDCLGVPFGITKIDACGVCGGTTTDATKCSVTPLCVTVQATSEILAFEKRLVTQAKTITKKYKEENKRNKRNKCNINTKPSTTRVNSALSTITNAGKDIFTKGVEICGEGCVTVSFADQVLALTPVIKVIEKETKTLAKKVQGCYKRKRIQTTKGTAGVAATIKTVTSDLKQLVKDCKDKQVCT